MHKYTRILVWIVFFFMISATAQARSLQVVTTTSDLASIVESIGGSKVSVRNLVKGNRDPHFVEVRPSMVTKVRDADLFVIVGMDLDIWARSLLEAARNPNVRPGGVGYLDTSTRIARLEVPEVEVDPSMGHLHVWGNPHYWLDPLNAERIAEEAAGTLSKLSPEDAAYFESNLAAFREVLKKKMEEWRSLLGPFRGCRLATYHRSWPYFLSRFGLESAGELEPKPGVPPTPAHLQEIVRSVPEREIRLILTEVFYDQNSAKFVSEKTGIPAITVANSVGGTAEAKDYVSMIDAIVKSVAEALKKEAAHA